MPVMDCPNLRKLRTRADIYPSGQPLIRCRPDSPKTRPPARPVKPKIKLPAAVGNPKDHSRRTLDTFLAWLEDERRVQLLTWINMSRNLHG